MSGTETFAQLRTKAAAPPGSFIASFEREGDELVRLLAYDGHRFESTVSVSVKDAVLAWWRAYWRGEAPRVDRERGRVRFMELFCGAGGLALGFRQAALELGLVAESVVAVDQDLEAVNVYARHHHTHWPIPTSVSELIDYRLRGRGDTAEFRYSPEPLRPELKAVTGSLDVLLAGPPCQGHSNLNNHSRREDPRNELYLAVPALAIALDVPIVIVENVPDVVRDSRGVVETTKSLLSRAGYEVVSGVLKADELGWPQRRRRFFLVAARKHVPLDLAAIRQGLNAPPASVKSALGRFGQKAKHDHMWRVPAVWPETQARLDWLFENDAYDLDLTERPDCHKDGTTYVAVYGRMRPKEPAPTITTGFLSMGRGRFVHPTKPRVITPAEAARLQGFPEDYDFSLADGSPPSSAKLSKWIGDAVPMALGHAASLSALLPLAVQAG